MFRRVIGAAIALFLIFLAHVPVHAHGGGIDIELTLSPEMPQPGQSAKVQVRVMDPYFNPIPTAHIKGSVEPTDETDKPVGPKSTFSLQEGPAGVYAGTITIPKSSFASFSFVVSLAGMDYATYLPLPIGQGAYPVKGLLGELMPSETSALPLGNPTAAPAPTVTAPAVPDAPSGMQPLTEILIGAALLVVACLIAYMWRQRSMKE